MYELVVPPSQEKDISEAEDVGCILTIAVVVLV